MELMEVKEKVIQSSFPNLLQLEQISEIAKQNNKIPKILHFCFLNYENMGEEHLNYLKTWFELLDNDWFFVNWTPSITPIETQFEQYCIDTNKFAFYADFIRCHKVYQYGGVYFDCDVKLLRGFNELLSYNYIFDTEFEKNYMECAAFMSKKGNNFLKIICDEYDNLGYTDYEKNPSSFVAGKFWLNTLNNNGVSVGVRSSNNLANYKEKTDKNTPNQLYCLDSTFLSCPPVKSRWTNLQQTPHEYTISQHMFMNTWLDKN